MSPALSAPPTARVALVGSPNSGKTTLFNALTGHRAKTGNYAGVTVERKSGLARTGAGQVELIDLPGTYSLNPISADEAIVQEVLSGERPDESRPDAIAIVADATSLERSLPMIAEVLKIGLPCCLVLTMIDELKARGGSLDLFKLQRELSIPVIGVVGNRGTGIDDLRAKLDSIAEWPRASVLPEGDVDSRFQWADALLARCDRQPSRQSTFTRRLDAVLLHPVLGVLVFIAFTALFFQAIFSWADPAMGVLEGLLETAATWVETSFADGGLVTAFLADGILRGVGAVVVFLPQILIVFTVIYLFEACGYMARAAFVIDRVMGWAGLEGRCFVALLSSYACAIPGIMATRTIPSPKDRLATMLVAPFMTCSARLPVYALLVGNFIPDEPVLGFFTLQGLTLMGLYLLGSVTALLFAALFKRGLLRGASLPFYLELPPYRFPSLKTVGVQVLRRALLFLRRAGTVILAASIVLWVLLSFPRQKASERLNELESRAEATGEEQQAGWTLGEAEERSALQLALGRQQIENSYGGRLGKALEPAIRPMDWDWRIGIGLIASLAAREVVVAAMAQVYAVELGEDDDSTSLGQYLSRPDPKTGEAPLSYASALALLVFFVFALQCISTLAVMRRETGSWRWPVFAFGYMSALAWGTAWLTYVLAA